MTKHTTKKNVYDIATEKILEHLEKGTVPWRKPWQPLNGGIAPQNYASKRVYRGLNFFLLAMTGEGYFMTFRQVKKAGGNIRKGAKSMPVFFWNWIYLDADGKKVKDEADAYEKRAYMKFYRVFGASDIEGIEFEYPEGPELQQHERIERCEAIVAGTGANVISKDKNRAWYRPATDEVNIPDLEQFRTPESYYGTTFHELGHWTGHKSRLDRFNEETPTQFGDRDYSQEELVAEMTSAFLCAHAGIDTDEEIEQSAAYIDNWIKALKGNSRLVVYAAAQAQKAADYILNK